ncbi:MAG: hypothetical protein Q8R76_10890 [Candidatus Omnitrophota bacterium]|nr:hypothetical protein [Candidatus Omnitrophota bacterium]
MYRKSDLKFFATFSIIGNLLMLAAFLLIIIYHFYVGKVLYRQLAICLLVVSVFMKFQIFMLKISVLEIRLSNLIEVGERPGKIAFGSGILALILYSILFWLTSIGILLSLMPVNWFQGG